MKKQIWNSGWMITIYCILGIGIIICLISLSKNRDTNTINEDLCKIPQSIVLESLKSPYSAVFQDCKDATITQINNYTYEINSYVDSENGFGAMLRTYYSITINLQNVNETINSLQLSSNPFN